MFAPGDVLQVTAVTLDALKVKTRRDVHAFGDRERLGRTEDARSTETDVDVARAPTSSCRTASAAASNSSTPSQ